MPLSYTEFKDELRLGIKRGTSYDSRLDGLVRRAVRWIEQNYTLQYMRKRVRVESQIGDDSIPLPANVPIKSVEFLRFVASDGTRIECVKGELSDPEIQWGDKPIFTGRASELVPTHFYLDGVTHLIFNREFTEVMDGVGIMAVYSDFPIAAGAGHWLLSNAEGLLLRQCMVEFMTAERDDRGAAAMTQKREEDVRALLNADFEVRFTGQDMAQAL